MNAAGPIGSAAMLVLWFVVGLVANPLLAAWLRLRLGKSQAGRATLIEDIERQILEALPNPKQRAYVLDPSRRFCALTGRGAGKTSAARARLVLKAVRVPRARLLFVATTEEQAVDLMWEPLKELLGKLQLRYRANETRYLLTLEDNKSTIRLVGADKPRTVEKLRGRPWHEVIIDEAASYTPKLLRSLIFRIIGPRLGDFGGVLGMQGTPGHTLNGLFYDGTRIGSDIGRLWEDRDKVVYNEDGSVRTFSWSVHKWTLLDGVAAGIKPQINLWNEALTEKRENKWSDRHPIWMREYLGIWVADDTEMMYRWRPHTEDGKPWNEWSPEGWDPEKRTGWAVLPPGRTDWLYAWGLDLGHGTALALQVLAFSPTDPDKNIYQVYEFHRRGMYAKPLAQVLIGEQLDLEHPGGVLQKTGWPVSAVADDSNLGDAWLAELQNVYGIRFVPAEKKQKRAAVELTNGDLEEGRIHVLKGSHLAEEMATLQWRENEHGVLCEPKHGDNAADGFIYPRRDIAAFFRSQPKPPGPTFPPRIDAIAEGERLHAFKKQADELLSADYYDENEGW